MVNADRVADSAISASPGHIAMSDSGSFMGAVIAAPYVVEVPDSDIGDVSLLRANSLFKPDRPQLVDQAIQVSLLLVRL